MRHPQQWKVNCRIQYGLEAGMCIWKWLQLCKCRIYVIFVWDIWNERAMLPPNVTRVYLTSHIPGYIYDVISLAFRWKQTWKLWIRAYKGEVGRLTYVLLLEYWTEYTKGTLCLALLPSQMWPSLVSHILSSQSFVCFNDPGWFTDHISHKEIQSIFSKRLTGNVIHQDW